MSTHLIFDYVLACSPAIAVALWIQPGVGECLVPMSWWRHIFVLRAQPLVPFEIETGRPQPKLPLT